MTIKLIPIGHWCIFAQENMILGMSVALKLIQERAIYFKSEQKGEGGSKIPNNVITDGWSLSEN